MKRFCATLVSMCIVMTLIVPSMAISLSDNTEISYLIEYGIPRELLEEVNAEKIHEWYGKAKSNMLRYEGEKTMFLYTDEGESAYGAIPAADMSLKINSIVTLENDLVTVDGVFFVIRYQWAKGHPSVCKEDGVVVNWDSDLFYMEPDSFLSEDYCYENGKLFQTYNQQSEPTLLNQGGLGYSVQLIHLNLTTIERKGSASFVLKPRAPMYQHVNDDKKDKYTSSVNIQYTHDKTPLIGGINFIYQGVGVSLTLPAMTDSIADNAIVRYSKYP